ncbi:hypothetical protein Tco_0027242 [Tanacetum coccineum]
MVSSLNDEIDFRIAFDDSGDEDYTHSRYGVFVKRIQRIRHKYQYGVSWGPSEGKSTNVGGEFTNLEILKCWSLETSRRLFNTNSCSIKLNMENLPSKYQGSFSF